MEENRRIIHSVKDVEVRFRVRDNYLTAIRNVSLDLYEGVLHVISVDDVTEITEGSGADQITIGVIE